MYCNVSLKLTTSNTFVTVFSNLLLKLVNKNTAIRCLFMLAHSALANVNKYNFDFNNVLVNVK